MKKVAIGMAVLALCAGMAMAAGTKEEPSQAEKNSQAYETGRSMGANSALGLNPTGNTCSSTFSSASEMRNCNNGFRQEYKETLNNQQKSGSAKTEE